MPASNHSRSSSDAEDDVDDQDNREVEVRIPHARWSLADQISPNSAALLAYGLPPMHDCISPASLMPPEILIHILRLISSPHDLYSALLVSRTWAECTVELLWHKPSLVKPSSLVKLLQTLSRDPDRVTFAYPSFIRRLNLVNHAHELTDASFTRIAVCSRLERLTLVGCEQLTDDSLCRVFGSVPNLVALDLTGVSNVSDLAILILAGVAKKLQGINLGGCKQISNESIIALSENCPLLRRIKLSGLERLTDPAVTALAKGCPLLLEVDLNDCKAISGRCVRDLWRFPRCMREMRLSGCADVGEEGFPAPPLPGAPDAYGVYPFNNNPASAQWGYSSEEDPTEPNAPLPALRLQHSYDTLRMLDLTSCIALTDTAVEGIIAAAPRIRNLVLAKCGEITDKGVEAICKLGRSLHYLHLGHANLWVSRA
jgi:F-box and leucine-rich repeat protein GRR1